MAEMVREALGALPKQSAVAACVDWADGTGLIGELNIAVLDRMTEELSGDAPDLEIRPD